MQPAKKHLFIRYSYIAFACIFAASALWRMNEIYSGRYIIRQQDIYAIDTFRSSGHINFDRGTNKRRENQFTFYADRDMGRFAFTIKTAEYDAVTEKELLTRLIKDTGHLFQVYATKKTAERYREAEKALSISVLQLEIDGKKFIDTGLANKNKKKELQARMFMHLLALAGLSLFLVYSYYRKKRTGNAHSLPQHDGNP